MSLEAYSVAVKLSLVNHVSSGLLAMSAQFNKTGKDAKALQAELHKIKLAGAIGGAMMGAGALGLAALFKGPLEEAKKFQVEVAKFSSLGFGSAIDNQAMRFANGMKTIGTSARDNMSIVGDAMAVFKDLSEAEMVSPLMAKMKFANEVIFGAGGGDRDKKLMDMMKVAEFRGGTKSPEEFARQANFAQQAIAGSRNRVDPTAMLLALKTGGVALSRRSNEAFYLGAEPLLQEFGGSRYGTGAMSIYQNLVQSRGSITAQQELYRLGLLNKDMVQFNQLGKLKKALPGAFLGSATLEKEGELALLEKVLLPAFAKKGITTEEAVLRELGMIMGNRTGSSLMSRIYQQREKLHMQTDANYHAENLDQASARAAGTLQGKEADLHAKWATLMKDLGVTILPMAISGVRALTSLLKGAAWVAEEFPTLTAGLMGAFTAVSAALLGGGAYLGLTAAFKALALALPGISGVGGIPLLTASLVGKAGLVVACGAAGYALGTLINGGINGFVKWLTNGKEDTLGGAIYDATHWKDSGKSTAVPVDFGSAEAGYQRPASRASVTHVTNVHLDGHKIAQVVTKHQGRAASQPQGGMSGFDTSMLFPSPANPY